jgi:hypothetical protein
MASLALFLATGPGTQGTAAALLFRNSFLRLVAGLGQVLACVWAFAFVLALLRNAPRLRLEDVLPQRTLQADAELTKLAFQASVVYSVGVVVYVGLNWRPQDNNKDHYHAAIPPAVVQLLFFLVVLAALVLPGLAAWQQRRAFLILLLQCASCIVGYSPLARIDFEHVLLTDILTSTSTAVYDLVFAGCHFADGNFRDHSLWQDSKVIRDSTLGVKALTWRDTTPSLLATHRFLYRRTHLPPVKAPAADMPFMLSPSWDRWRIGCAWYSVLPCAGAIIQGARQAFLLLLATHTRDNHAGHSLALRREARRVGHVGWPATQHLANAGKYFISILGTLLVSAIQFEKHYNHSTGDVSVHLCFAATFFSLKGHEFACRHRKGQWHAAGALISQTSALLSISIVSPHHTSANLSGLACDCRRRACF